MSAADVMPAADIEFKFLTTKTFTKMKKNLLFCAAMLVSVAASAQTVVYPCHGTTADKKTATSIDISAVVSGSTTITGDNPVCGSGIKDPSTTMTVQGTCKNPEGTAFEYPETGVGIVKWVPNVANGTDVTPKTIEDAVANNQYIDFKVTENDQTKFLEFANVKFDAWRYGTDAVRINVKLLANGDDGEYESDWLINKEVAATFGDNYESWKEGDGTGDQIPGYMPSREDASKGETSTNQTPNYSSHVTIAKPADFPSNVYAVTLRILIYGIADNKAAGFENITFNFGTDAIQSVTAEKTNVNAPIYNLAGQQVNKSYKGVCIQNGRKFINK